MIEAINDALHVVMERDDDVVVFGEDAGYFGGVFAAPPACRRSSAFVAPSTRRSTNAGSSARRSAWRPMVAPVPEIQFADYI